MQKSHFEVDVEDYGEIETPSAEPPRPVSPVSLMGLSVPGRQWIVPDWLPCGVVTGLYGDGGLGKSLLAQQLQTAMALGAAGLLFRSQRARPLASIARTPSMSSGTGRRT
jgi:hypothetical protein